MLSAQHRWLLLVGALSLGSGAGAYLAVSSERQEQARQLKQVAGELKELRQALRARPPALSPPARAVQANTAKIGPPLEQGPGAALSMTELEVLAQRLAALLQEQGGLASEYCQPERKPEAPKVLSQEQTQALSRANGMVDRVLATRRMSSEDLLRIRHELEGLGAHAEADTVRRRIAAAINQQKLVPPAEGSFLP